MRAVPVILATSLVACGTAGARRAPATASSGEPHSCGPATGTPVAFDERMTPPTLRSGPDPSLTVAALSHDGEVRARCRLTVDGCVDRCRIVKSDPAMDAEFVDTLERRRYSPATLYGKPVEVDYGFRLTWKVPRF